MVAFYNVSRFDATAKINHKNQQVARIQQKSIAL
jgi:hypothetical protein